MREAGFSDWDAHAPFFIPTLAAAMGLRRSRLGWLVFGGALAGAGLALLLQAWTMVTDYPLVTSGKPHFSWPAFVPICFELMILCAVLAAFVGMLAASRLPRPYAPHFRSPRFDRVTDDRFFISVAASDPRFDPEQTARLLRELGATNVELLEP